MHPLTMTQNSKTFNARYEVILVTPDMAASWLKNNASFQRNLSERKVKEYEAMMRRGEWMVTHQAVGIDPSGVVIDGQHRLQAVVRTGVPVLMTVAFNVDPSTFLALDRGFVRSYEQLAKMNGYSWANTSIIAGAHTLLWNPSKPGSVNRKWSVAEMGDVLDYFKDELAVVYPPKFSGHSCLVQASVRGAALRVLVSNPASKSRISDFIACIATALPTEHGGVKDSPALLLRNHMNSSRMNKEKVSKFAAFCVTLKVLRHFIAGTRMTHDSNMITYRESENHGWFPLSFDDMPTYMSFGDFVSSLPKVA